MLKVGITGGIGSGKTTVCRIFETLGVPVFYADDESRKILLNNAAVIHQLEKHFGSAIFSNGLPDSKKIAEHVFSDNKELEVLNQILHPFIFQDYNNWICERVNIRYTMMEAALIYDTGADALLDKVIVVSAPESLRINRIMRRNNLMPEDVLARMRHQLDPVKIESKADFIIHNDEGEMLIPQIMMIHKTLMQSDGENFAS